MTAEHPSPASPPPASLALCPECGGAAGGEAFPRRWRRARWLTLLGVLLVWGLWVGETLRRAFGPAMVALTAGNHPHIYPLNAVDVWFEQVDAGYGQSPDYYVREVFTRSYGPWVPVPPDEPLEVALVGNAVVSNLTPWSPSSLSMREVVALRDAEFVAIARADLVEAFGDDWDGPAQTNIAWRVRVPSEPAIRLRQYRAPLGLSRTVSPPWLAERWVGLTSVDLDWADAPMWARPAPGMWASSYWFRWADDSTPGRWWVLDISVPITIRVFGLLIGSVVLAWLLAPPIWKRRARKRWAKRGCCLGCGYDLRMRAS